MNTPIRLLLCSAIASALPTAVAADPVPNALRFSVGVQRNGAPFSGDIDIQLQFFSTATGNTPTIPALVIENIPVQGGVGFFTADFGTTNPMNDEETWIGGGIRLGSSTGSFSPLTQRARFTPGAYALHAQKVAGGAIGLVQIRSDEVQSRIAGECSASAAIRRINQDGSVVCETVSGSGGGGGIAGVTAGTGLAGGGSSGVVELRVADGGIGTTQLAASAVDTTKIADGSIAGIDVDALQIQLRLSSGCAEGAAIRSVGADGTVTCETVAGGAAEAWQLDGNAASAGQFVGTTNALPFELRAGGERGMRLHSLNDPDGGAYGGGLQTMTVEAGSAANGASAPGAAVLGGGNSDFPNHAGGRYSTVLGGRGNDAFGAFAVALGDDSSAGGEASFAGGRLAIVRGPTGSNGDEGDAGTFVWSDSQSLSFVSTGDDQFLVRASGGFGLNTNMPLADMHASRGLPAGFGTPSTGTLGLFTTSFGDADLTLAAPSTAQSALRFSNGAQSGRLQFDAAGNGAGFDLVVPNAGTALSVSSVGAVSIGPSAGGAAHTLHGPTTVQGNLVVNGTISASNCCSMPSDLRIKQAVEPIAAPLDRLLALQGYRFRYTEDAVARFGLPDTPQLGFIAQELGAFFPEWSFDDPRGFQSVSLRSFDALLVEAVRDLAARDTEEADTSLARMQRLEAENRALRARLDALERALDKR